MIKKMLSFVTLFTLIISINTATTFAAEDSSKEQNTNSIQEISALESTIETSQLFIDYLTNALNNSSNLQVIDANGADVTQSFIDYATVLYQKGEYNQIKKSILDQKLSVSYAEYHQAKEAKGLELSVMAMGDNVSKQFYHIATDTTGKYTKEWVTTLSGQFSYGNTFQIISIQGPTTNLYANFGAAFAASLNNVNTNSYYSGYKATFVASYQLKASLSVPFPGGTNGVVTYDFGSYTDSFNAYPSAMQN